MHQDDTPIGRILSRRDALAVLGTTAGAAVVATWLPWRWAPAPALAAGCVVRPDQVEGPYFVDERLNRSDIRTDPSDGSVSAGTTLALAFAVSAVDGASCVPLAGAVVDVWHCDAAGVYSDVDDPSFDNTGQKFLRGYQTTDAAGAASFVTIWPGWYQGRTVHIHFKVRTAPDDTSGFEFTSQLYLDDALTDVVHAAEPYASKGQRTLRNAGDGIYANGGGQLLLTPTSDGAGGWTTTFDIAVDLGGTTTSTVAGGGSTTTTTLAGACGTIVACLADLAGALPDPQSAASTRAARTARKLERKLGALTTALDAAAGSTGARQARRHRRAHALAQSIRTLAEKADGKGTLGASLAGIQAAVVALVGQLAA